MPSGDGAADPSGSYPGVAPPNLGRGSPQARRLTAIQLAVAIIPAVARHRGSPPS